MPNTNGQKPQKHLSVREIVALHKARMTRPWHSDLLDMNFLIRPRTAAEVAQLSDEGGRLTADMERYKGTPDEPGGIEQLRIGIRSAIPLLLDPDTHEPRFGIDEIDDLLDLPMEVINELVNAANETGVFTKAQADDAAKNSVEIIGGNSSLISPDTAATSTSSPTPMP